MDRSILNRDLLADEEFFLSKVPMTKSEYEDLIEEYRVRAFTVSKYTDLQVLKKFHDELMKAIENGSTINEFRESMNDFLSRKGFDGITKYQADNIFRTNIQTAYNVGHYKAMISTTVKKARPYWMYSAVNDSHTRPSHLAMDGKVFHADDPVWDTWYPPNGFRCRCTVITLSPQQVERMGLEVSEGQPPNGITPQGELVPIMPDKLFNKNIAKQFYELDVSTFPAAMQAVYNKTVKNAR